MTRTILIAPTEAVARRNTAAYFRRFDYEARTPDTEADLLAQVRAARGFTVLLADADRGGLALAHAARAVRRDLPVVLTCLAPHRLPGAALAGAPVVRAPATPHLLLSVVSGLGRRVVDEAA